MLYLSGSAGLWNDAQSRTKKKLTIHGLILVSLQMRTQHATPANRQKGAVAHTHIDKPAIKDEVAAHFRVHRRTVDYWIANQLMPIIKINRTVRFSNRRYRAGFHCQGAS